MKDKDYMTAVYTYDDLVKAYDNFLSPAIAIYLNNSTDNILQTKGIAIDNVQVTLSAEETAGLNFQVTDVFDSESHSIKSEVKNNFSVGTVIELALGYGSDLTTVFKGYVAEYKTSYQNPPVISVSAVDLRKLLMQNKRERYKHTENTYSKIFSNILGNYRDLYGTLHIDEVETKEEIIQNSSDYDFIKRELCHKADREFFVVGADVYFKEPGKSKTAFLQLKWGQNLISFQKGSSYCNEQIKAYSSQEDKTGNMVSAVIKTENDTPSLTVKDQIEEWELGEGMDKETLQNWLNKKAEERKRKSLIASGSLIGLPEIVPGRYIEIKGVDSADEGTYYITEVSHSFGSDGFTTNFTVGEKTDKWILNEERKGKEGAGKCSGVMRAVVKENWNEEQPGKVLVEFLTGEQGKNNTKWLPVLQPYCGNGYGFYFHPEIDTEVVVGSLMGDVNSLMVLGGLWNQVDGLPADTAGEKNTIKKIRTKGNHEIIFDDDKETAKIQIYTGNKLQIELNDKEECISIFDDKKENGLQINAKDGDFHIYAKKKIILSAGDKETIIIDGDNKITIEANQIEEKGTQSFQMKTQKLEISGDMTEIKAGGSMKINSSGITEIKGSMVKIN